MGAPGPTEVALGSQGDRLPEEETMRRLSKPQIEMLLECMFSNGFDRIAHRARLGYEESTWNALVRRGLLAQSMDGAWHVTMAAKDALSRQMWVG